MAQDSKIEWCDHTVNLWWGCSKVHTGCKNCYAEYLSDTRYKNNLWGVDANRKQIKSSFKDLDFYQKNGNITGKKYRVFVGSMMDIFEDTKNLIDSKGEPLFHIQGSLQGAYESETNTNDMRRDLFYAIDAGYYSNIIFLFLTKRPENIVKYIPTNWVNNECPKNVWFGTSVSNQDTWEFAERLKEVPVSNRFLSIEPQVGMIDNISLLGIHWVIQGGESGHKKRPFELEWAYKMKSICQTQQVPYFFKQIDKVKEIPSDLLIREFPLR